MKLLIQIALIVMVSISMQVFAHAGLKSSIPNDQERITEQPKNIVLEFNKPVRLLKVTMVDRKGEVVPLKYRMSTNADDRFEISIAQLQHGHYIVKWVALGGDSHKMDGDFSFEFQPAKAASKQKSEEVENPDHTSHQH